MTRAHDLSIGVNDVAAPPTIPRGFETARDGFSAVEFDVQPNSVAPRMPTAEAYAFWQGAFSFFNERLFHGVLSNSLITLSNRPRALGYFCPRAFEDRDGAVAHQIAMNPTWFEACGDVGSLSVLVHEMQHQWREDHGPLNRKGSKGRGGYHDLVWADAMERAGLMPSDTGQPGGKRTGFRVSHYIVENGPFDRVCRELLGAGYRVNWRDTRIKRPPSPFERGPAMPPAISKSTRTRFVCSTCPQKLWAAASAQFSCRKCSNAPMLAR
ncbi:MAG: sprT domain-containing protein [Rhizobiaceae bacterium]